MNTIREDFEAWAKSEAYCCTRSLFNSENYKQTPTQVAWESWKACCAARQPVTMRDALAAGDGTLHGAIDHWQERALRAEAEIAARQPVGEVVAYRLVTGDPKRKWMAVQGFPPVGVQRQAADHGWQIEYLYAAPPQQPERVDWEQFKPRIEAAIDRILNHQCLMRVPVDDTDPDIVLADILRLINQQESKP